MKTAIVHDYLTQAGGAERVAAVLHTLYPQAPLYTSIYDAPATLPEFAGMDIRTSFLQKWPIATRQFHKLALPYYRDAFEQFDFSGYDLVVSSASSFAKGVITPPEACHICYCHTPSRFAWRGHEYLMHNGKTRLLAPLLRSLLRDLRLWDFLSAQRVDYFVANSFNTARRIRKFYRRDVATVIYPPVETRRFSLAAPADVGAHFLIVSRLVGYKRVDLAIDACNKLGVKLRIVGTGPEAARLRRRAGPTVTFLGRLPDHAVAEEYARCRALIFPGEEDFGLTPLEAMASGRPVVAYGAGGALETVVDGKTGLFFREQTPEALASALREIQTLTFDPHALSAHAAAFDTALFRDQMARFVETAVAEYREIGQGGPEKNAVWNEMPDPYRLLNLRLSKGE